MKLENQVASIEQAKKLKELGVTAPAIWYWVFPAKEKMLSTTYGIYYHEQASDIVSDNDGDEFDHDSAAAYSVAELGVALPDYITIENYYRTHFNSYKQEQNNSPALFTATYGKTDDMEIPDFDGHNEAFIRANLLIFLIENKFITSEQINQRLLTT